MAARFKKDPEMKMTILLSDGYTALDIVGGYEVLANVPGIDIEFAARETGLVWADTRRLALHAWRRFDDVATTDILYVPGGPGVAAALDDPALMETIRRLDASSTWTVGICNGVQWLGHAGLIGGQRVTTNWAVREQVAAYGATVVTDRWCQDGKLFTGAGVSASIDAALALTALVANEAVARTVQLGIEYYPQPPQGNGTPDQAPDSARKLVREFEASALERLRSKRPPV